MDEDFVREFFAAEGPVSIRRMFGGYGVYVDGLIVAVCLRGDLLLKADAESAPFSKRRGPSAGSINAPEKPLSPCLTSIFQAKLWTIQI